MSSSNMPQKTKISLAPVKALSNTPSEMALKPAAEKLESVDQTMAKSAAVEKPAAAKSAPAAVKPPAAVVPASKIVISATAPSSTALVSKALAKTAPTSALASMGEAILKRQIAAAQLLGSLQAMTLDHAVSGLKAGLAEAEELSQTTSISDVMAIQARAFSRSQQSFMSYLSDLTNSSRP